MTTNETYNGWTNHATWLVNLWWGDAFFEMDLRDPEEIRDFVYTIIDEQTNSVECRFVMDMVEGYMHEVNWQEIAATANEQEV